MLEDCGYTLKETMVLPENSLVVKTQILRLADVKEFSVLCFINENSYSLRDSVIEMSEWNVTWESPCMKSWNDRLLHHSMCGAIAVLRRKKTLILYLENSHILDKVELKDVLKCMKNDDNYDELD